MTSSIPSDNSFQLDQTSNHANLESSEFNTESTYTDLINTFKRLGVNAAYQDMSKLDFNIFEIPDLMFLGGPGHVSVIGETGSGMTAFVTQNYSTN